jgi:hypothetical protein
MQQMDFAYGELKCTYADAADVEFRCMRTIDVLAVFLSSSVVVSKQSHVLTIFFCLRPPSLLSSVLFSFSCMHAAIYENSFLS